jgi:hypothetical protein
MAEVDVRHRWQHSVSKGGVYSNEPSQNVRPRYRLLTAYFLLMRIVSILIYRKLGIATKLES